jgi:ATP/maltotriose-dependent transcriptional regulator MalT
MTTQQLTDYMSPYQQQVIDATMTEFDAQAQRRENERAAAALGIPGAYGGGREGVQAAQYQTESDRNRAALLAQLSQQGFQQAQAGRQQDFANQQALATQQAGLGTQAMGNVQRQIAGLGTLGATQQAQTQAGLDASRQFAQMAVQEPTTRLGMLGTGVTGLMGGTQGLGTKIGEAPPTTSPLGTALGIGSTLAGIYGMGFLK